MKFRITLYGGMAASLLCLSSCSFLTSLFQAKPRVAKSPAVETPAPPEKEPQPEMRSYTGTPTAKWTDDVPNSVWSPYLDGKKVAVDGIAPGTLVADPNCPEPMKALFYVPEVP